MNAFYIEPNELEQLSDAFSKLENDNKFKSALFFMADKNMYSKKMLDPILKDCQKKIIGGIFPEIIYEGKRKSEGVILIPLLYEIDSKIINLENDNDNINEQLENNFRELSQVNGTLLVFTDALGTNKSGLIETLFNYFGINVNYLGGGAGSLNFKPFPCVINNTGIYENAAVVALIPEILEIGVAHGWSAITKPMKVTKSFGNKVISINWEPAFEVYKKVVEEHSGMVFKEDNFFDIAKSYPLGIAIMDAEMVVRDPIMVDGDDMLIVDAVNEGEHISIMHGDMTSLLKGAEKAREIAFSNAKSGEKDAFCIDCISRVLYMNEDIDKELSIIQDNGRANGILTIGEIANSGESFLEIYNKTIVVAKW